MTMDQQALIREIQQRYRQTGRAFNELERREWAAAEAIRLGRGGITLVSRALRMSPNTIKRGILDREAGSTVTTPQKNARIRKPGGGRKHNPPTINRELDSEIESNDDTNVEGT